MNIYDSKHRSLREALTTGTRCQWGCYSADGNGGGDDDGDGNGEHVGWLVDEVWVGWRVVRLE
jgi:hypothetical protein